jgi:hypothetical protein
MKNISEGNKTAHFVILPPGLSLLVASHMIALQYRMSFTLGRIEDKGILE